MAVTKAPGQLPRPIKTLGDLWPWLMIILLLAFAFPALDQYNITWDEGLGDLFFGERYLSFFTSFDAAYLDFENSPYPPERTPDLSISPFKVRPWEYYPVANTLAAGTSEVLSRRLGWLDPFDGFHALNLWLAALLIAGLYPMVRQRWGTLAAAAALGFLFTAPRVFCHMMANIKDFPLMVFFTGTVLAFLWAFEKGSTKGIWGAGILWGLALGTKANALFLPAIPAAVWLLGKPLKVWQGPWQGRRRTGLHLIAAGAIGTAVMVASWPYLWADPIGRFLQHLEYIGLRRNYTRSESMAPVLEAIFQTTPPIFLAFFAFGCIPLLRKAWRRDPFAIALLAWMGVVLGRYLLPQAVNFDGVRHFLELFPAMAMVAGLGVSSLHRLIVHRLPVNRATAGGQTPTKHKLVAATLLAVAVCPGAWAVLRTHPFQIAYWNVFVGGFAGARDANLPQASDYWGMSYRLGFEWLNENAPPGSLLAVPVVEHAVRLVAGERLREDFILLPVTNPFTPRIDPERLRLTRQAAQSQPLYVMFVERRDWMNALMVDCLRFLKPEVVWELEGTPVLSIYRYRYPLSDTVPLPSLPPGQETSTD